MCLQIHTPYHHWQGRTEFVRFNVRTSGERVSARVRLWKRQERARAIIKNKQTSNATEDYEQQTTKCMGETWQVKQTLQNNGFLLTCASRAGRLRRIKQALPPELWRSHGGCWDSGPWRSETLQNVGCWLHVLEPLWCFGFPLPRWTGGELTVVVMYTHL